MSDGPASPAVDHRPDARRWVALEPIFHDALARHGNEREAYITRMCPDAEMRRELEALLVAHEQTGRLDVIGDRVLAPLIAGQARLRRGTASAHDSHWTLPALGRYRVIEKLGGGGMGIVYRARDERLERDVALKFLPPHMSADEAAKKRFLVEARAAASLEHPNICTVHEIGETADGQLYIVMGCYEGETLDRAIARGPLPVGEVLRIALEVARGLAKAHERRIIHRDVKPANIMLTSDGMVKILDFGIAKLSDIGVTQTAGVVGTLAYMSPEQAFGERVDARTDIWALGVVVYEMLTGQRPFHGPGEQAILYSILTSEIEAVETVGADLAPGMDAFLRRATAKRPDKRFAGAQEVIDALSELQAAARGVRTAPVAQRASGSGVDAPAGSRSESLLALAGERRHAAVVVTGVVDHAGLIERLAPDEVERAMRTIRKIATEVAARHGGIVNHFAGDEAVLLFGVAAAHEDDPMRAVRAALELHARVRDLTPPGAGSVPLRMRSGLHTGALVAQRLRSGDRRFRLTGAPLDLATRLAALAGSDVLLVSPEAHRLIAPFVESAPTTPMTLQPDMTAVVPLRVTGESSVFTRLEAAERTGLTPFAGRERELQSLLELLDAAISGEGGFAAIIGDPGAGKSRLLFELRRRVGGVNAQLAFGRCDAYGTATPYMPVVQALVELLGLAGSSTALTERAVVERILAVDASLEPSLPLFCALLSVESPAHPLPRHLQGEHLQAAMLEAIAALITLQARRRPLILLLEDWHWSDDASRRALEQLAEIAPAYPLLLVVTCRPESGIEWSSGERRVLVHLRPLGLEGTTEIIRGVLGADRVAAVLAEQLHERTAGNPFFLEETCQGLLEQGAVVVRDGEAMAEQRAALTELPETVQAVIRTRLDRLAPDTRDMLRVASVIGRDFTRAVLDEMTDADLDDGRHLNELRRTGLVQQTSVAPEPAYRFKHVLTQEVAYDTLLEHQREMLHGKAAAAIERRYADRLDEHRERLAHHYSRAGHWLQATTHGIQSADRSHALSQFADALAMLDRVRDWVTKVDDEAHHRELLADVLFRQERLCETLGLRARQIAIVEDLIALLAPHGGSARLAEAYLRQGDVFILLGRFDAADRSLATSIRLSRELGDRAGERNAVRSLGLLRSHEGRYADAVSTIEQALTLDAELGEPGAAAGDVASLGNVLRKMGRPHDAIAALEKARAYLTPEDDPTKWCAVLTVIASAYRDLGDADTALRYLEAVRDAAIARRLPIMTSFCLPAIAHIQLQRGQVEDGLATYRQAAELSRRARHAEGIAQSLRALGEVYFGLERFEEAVPHLREAAVVFAQLENRDTETLLWQRLATASERCGRPDEALQLWERIHARCEGAGDAGGEALALEGIARCARLRGVREAAIGLYERALGRAVAAGDLQRESTLRNTLGLLRWEDGAYGEALRQYEGALRLCRERVDRVHEGLVLNSLGATLLKLRRYDEARTVLEEAARVNASTGQRRMEAHSHAVLGDSLLAAGRPADAEEAFRRSLALRPELGDRRGEGWMLERLGQALMQQGRTSDAAAAFGDAATVAREIDDDGLASAVERRRASRAGDLNPQRT